MEKKKYLGRDVLHFSVDDIFDTLIESRKRNIPFLAHEKLSFLVPLHEKYGLEVDLYAFFRGTIGGRHHTLEEVADIRDDIRGSGDWVHFGPHALDYYHAPYEQTPEEQIQSFDKIYTEIDRFAGKEARADSLRLHYYSESYELAEYFKKNGVERLFSTDRSSGSHRMPAEKAHELLVSGKTEYSGLKFERTQLRLEFLIAQCYDDAELETLLRQLLAQYGRIVLYTHECELANTDIQNMLVRICESTYRIVKG